MKQSVIVWDLETVPDLGGFAAANDLVGKSDVEVREAIGDKFPKHIYHSIVCIGALIAHWEPDHWAVAAVGAPHVGERTEKQLITAFCDKVAGLRAPEPRQHCRRSWRDNARFASWRPDATKRGVPSTKPLAISTSRKIRCWMTSQNASNSTWKTKLSSQSGGALSRLLENTGGERNGRTIPKEG
jgi:hypothetical protein